MGGIFSPILSLVLLRKNYNRRLKLLRDHVLLLVIGQVRTLKNEIIYHFFTKILKISTKLKNLLSFMGKTQDSKLG